eukprot:1159946-Pelagomonas_calceolata.AAC.9
MHMQTPEDWERARAQMQGMSPEQLRQQAAAAQQHMSSQERYMLSVSAQFHNTMEECTHHAPLKK